jgi:hypothetical protein
MYACLRVCMYASIHVSMYVCICVCVCVYAGNACLHALYSPLYVYTITHEHMNACLYLLHSTYLCTHSALNAFQYMYKCVYNAFMCTYMYVCACMCIFVHSNRIALTYARACVHTRSDQAPKCFNQSMLKVTRDSCAKGALLWLMCQA